MTNEFENYPTEKQAIKSIERLKKIEWPKYIQGDDVYEYISQIENEIFKEFPIIPNFFRELEFSDFNLKIFRTRAVDSIRNINTYSEHSYPPAQFTGFGRCNFPNYPIFYSSNNALTALKETVRANSSDSRKFCITKWKIRKSTEKIIFQNFLHTHLNEDNHFKKLTESDIENIKSTFDNRLNDDQKIGLIHFINFLHDTFIKDKEYSLSASLAHRAIFAKHIKPSEILMYPSIQTQKRGVNLAIHPNFVDNRMFIQRFYIVELVDYIQETGRFNLRITQYGIAKSSGIEWRQIDPEDVYYQKIMKEDFGEMMDEGFSFNFEKLDNAK